MSPLTITVVLLVLLTLGNLFLLLGVIRKLREVVAKQDERYDHGHGAGNEEGLPAVGYEIPAFSQPTIDGGEVSAADLKSDQTLVVFLSPHCKPCAEVSDRLATHQAGLPERVLLFVEAEADDPLLGDYAAKLHGVGPIALASPASVATKAFQVTGYPTTILVDDGRVTAASFSFAEVVGPVSEHVLVQ